MVEKLVELGAEKEFSNGVRPLNKLIEQYNLAISNILLERGVGTYDGNNYIILKKHPDFTVMLFIILSYMRIFPLDISLMLNCDMSERKLGNYCDSINIVTEYRLPGI